MGRAPARPSGPTESAGMASRLASAFGGNVTFSPWATSLINIASIPAPGRALQPDGGGGLLQQRQSQLDGADEHRHEPARAAVDRWREFRHRGDAAAAAQQLHGYRAYERANLLLSHRRLQQHRQLRSEQRRQCRTTGLPPADKRAATGLSVTGTTGSSVALAWAAPSNTFGVAGYTIYRNGHAAIATSTTTTYIDATVSPTTTYTYAVTTLDNTGAQSAASNTVTATTLTPGTGLLGTYYSGTAPRHGRFHPRRSDRELHLERRSHPAARTGWNQLQRQVDRSARRAQFRNLHFLHEFRRWRPALGQWPATGQ